MSEYKIRRAKRSDAAFVAKVILSAERGNSSKVGLSTLFNITEEEVLNLMIEILESEVDGCEWSLSSFLITEFEDQPIAGLGGWIEGENEGVSSSMIKSNLLNFIFPKRSLDYLMERAEILVPFRFDKEMGSLQLEFVYCSSEHRGKRICQKMIEEHIKLAKATDPSIANSQMQPYTNNHSAIKLFERSGFSGTKLFKSNHPDVMNFLPGDEKLLMERKL